jgi:hypothetical protein
MTEEVLRLAKLINVRKAAEHVVTCWRLERDAITFTTAMDAFVADLVEAIQPSEMWPVQPPGGIIVPKPAPPMRSLTPEEAAQLRQDVHDALYHLTCPMSGLGASSAASAAIYSLEKAQAVLEGA